MLPGTRMTTLSRPRALAIMAAVVVAISACDQEPARYASTDALVAALGEGGVRCTDLTSGGRARLVEETGRCSVGDANVDVFVFDKAGDLENWMQLGRLFRGELVVGPNWVVRANDAALRAEIMDALNGDSP